MFTATADLLAPRDARPFPDLEVEPVLAPGGVFKLSSFWPGHATLVTLSFKAFGRAQCVRWHEAAMPELQLAPRDGERSGSSSGGCRLVDLNFVEGVSYRLMKPLIRRGLRRLTVADPSMGNNPAAAVVTHFANYSEVSHSVCAYESSLCCKLCCVSARCAVCETARVAEHKPKRESLGVRAAGRVKGSLSQHDPDDQRAPMMPVAVRPYRPAGVL